MNTRWLPALGGAPLARPAAVVLLLTAATATPCQYAWLERFPLSSPQARSGHALAWDSSRGRLVLYGGAGRGLLDDTWEWDGVGWHELRPSASPPPRSEHAMAFDSARGRTVLFGGRDSLGRPMSDTWEWDGAGWTRRDPSNRPPARYGHALAYDSARGRVVSFGGYSSGSLSDTWEWDGQDWVQPNPVTSPPARSDHALAYDWARGKTVLFGGAGTTALLSDTWEWDGATWTQRAPTRTPPERYGHAVAHHVGRGRTILFGGRDANGFLQDVWEWDGEEWRRPDRWNHSGTVRPRFQHAMAFDEAADRVVLFGGFDGAKRADTWEYGTPSVARGALWEERLPSTSPTQQNGSLAMAYDSNRERSVLYQGGRTWEWDGVDWRSRQPLTSYSDVAMAFDSGRGVTVLVGDRANSTWEWDGTTWTQRTGGTQPPSGRPALAYDSLRRRTVLFVDSPAQTWEWDGTTWTQRVSSIQPPNGVAALAYDRRRGRTVLFRSASSGETWEWDGSNWALRTPATNPPGRSYATLVYDSARERVILFGGNGGPDGRRADVWEWDGQDWTQRDPAVGPPPREKHAAAFDSHRSRMVVFGGMGPAALLDTWEYSSACRSVGRGHPDGGLPLTCVTPPALGASLCLEFPSSGGNGLLLVGAGPCSSPQPFGPPILCRPGVLYPTPILGLPASGNPTSVCIPIPTEAALAGLVLCMQGVSLEASGCLIGTEGVEITLIEP